VRPGAAPRTRGVRAWLHALGEYLSAHITGPHGLDVWLGAPGDVIARAAKLTNRRPGRERDAPPVPAGSSTGTGPGTSPGTSPGAGAGPATGPGTGPGTGTSPGAGAGPGTGPATGPGTGPGTSAAASRAAAAFAAGAGGLSGLLWRTLYNPDVTSVPAATTTRMCCALAGRPAGR